MTIHASIGGSLCQSARRNVDERGWYTGMKSGNRTLLSRVSKRGSRAPTVVIDDRERDAFRARAAAEGLSLSAWLREAARERLEREQPTEIKTVVDLDRFFAERAAVEVGTEPEWDQHLDVMQRSRRTGLEPA